MSTLWHRDKDNHLVGIQCAAFSVGNYKAFRVKQVDLCARVLDGGAAAAVSHNSRGDKLGNATASHSCAREQKAVILKLQK
jgi:hypothetical protein